MTVWLEDHPPVFAIRLLRDLTPTSVDVRDLGTPAPGLNGEAGLSDVRLRLACGVEPTLTFHGS